MSAAAVSRGRSRTSRRPRERAARGASRVGSRYEVEVGPVAHGGHCVARVPTGEPGRDRVVFVRHALPGERVVVEVTEGTDGDRFWRGDAVTVLTPSPDRVPAPVPVRRARRLRRLRLPARRPRGPARAQGRAWCVSSCDAWPGSSATSWSRRCRRPCAGGRGCATSPCPEGRRGLHVHRSDEVVLVDDCLIDAAGAARSGDRRVPTPGLEAVTTAYGSRDFVVAPDGFWQSHVEAPRVLVETVLGMLRPEAGERVLDLYAGVGLFAAFLADAVGPTGRVVAVEGSRAACQDARTNLPPGVRVEHGPVERVLGSAYDEPFDLVVLDPPREGARRPVVEQIVDRAPRAVAYVACDPAALARDLATFASLGYHLTALRALDLFPMTHHVECVALVERGA